MSSIEVSSGGSVVRMVLIDDQSLIRFGLRAVLSREPWIEVVGEATDGVEAVELCRKETPDLVLMDIEMPHMDGLTATRHIKAELPATSVLVLTAHERTDYLLEAVVAGAAGYLLKEHARDRVVGAVRRVVSEESPLDQELAMALLRLVTDERLGQDSGAGESARITNVHEESGLRCTGAGRQEIIESLTVREREILSLLAEGLTNQQIAERLFVGMGTVKTHVHRIITKLGVSDRTQAAVLAIRLGLAGSSKAKPDGN